MSWMSVTTCDRCNPSGSLSTLDGRGYILSPPSEAIRLGWAEEAGADIEGTDDTHYCIECLAEEPAA